MNDEPTHPRPGQPSDEIVSLAEQRADARAERDWGRADTLKSSIEAAGWKVVDHGTDFVLAPARPPDVVADGATLIGASSSVVSRRSEPASTGATFIVIVGPADDAAGDAIAAIERHGPDGAQIIIVGRRDIAPLPKHAELIRTATVFTAGAAFEAALRGAVGHIILVVDAGQRLTGDPLAAVSAALEDPAVAIVGSDGLVSADLRRFSPGGPCPVAALGPACYAFRRSDAIERGPIDEALYLTGSVATWWSLALREATETTAVRHAIAFDLPLETPAATESADTERAAAVGTPSSREARRDAYRVARRFAGRPELAVAGAVVAADGPG